MPRRPVLSRRLSLAARVPREIARLTASPERLAAIREGRLRRLLVHARDHAPWHARRLHGVDVERFTEADLASLPPMTKDDVMANWDEVVTDPELTLERARAHVDRRDGTLLLDRYRAFATGGTSGRSGLFVYDREAWETALLAHLRANVRMRLRKPSSWTERKTVVSVVAEGTDHLSASVAQAFESRLVATHRFAVTHPLGDLCARLDALQPTTLVSYGSMLAELISLAERDRLHVRPSFVVSTSDPLTPTTREAIERLWGARIMNVWATTEVGPTALGCGEGTGMHLLDDLVIYEIVDENDRPVPWGAEGAKVLVTSLFNRAMPLVRYELGDETCLIEGPCPCGSTHRRIGDIQGRIDDALRWDDLRVDPHLFRSPLSHHTAVRQYQVVQTLRGVDVRLVADGHVATDELAAYWVRRLKEQGLPEPEVSVTLVPELPRAGAGQKIRRFVPLKRA